MTTALRTAPPALARLVVDEVTARESWAASIALVAHLALASLLFGAAAVGLVTTSHLGGQTGGAFRSFVVPGALVAIVGTAVSTRALVSVHAASSRRRRGSWAAAGVPRRAAGAVVAVHLAGVTTAGTLLGLVATDLVASTLGTVSVPTALGPVDVDLGLDVVGAVTTAGLVLVSVVPAVTPPVRDPYGASGRRRTLRVVRLVVAAAAPLGVAVPAAVGDVHTRDGLERTVALSLLLLLVLVVLTGTWLVRAVGALLRLLAGRLPPSTPVALLVAAGGASSVVRSSPGASAAVASVGALLGGVPAVFLAGDAVIRRAGAATDGPVDVGALLVTLAPALLLGAVASAVTFVVARPGRCQDTRILRASGAGPALLTATGLLEALLFGLPGMVASATVVTLALLPLALAGHLPPTTLVSCVVNPLSLVALGTTTLALVLAAGSVRAIDVLTSHRVTL